MKIINVPIKYMDVGEGEEFVFSGIRCKKIRVNDEVVYINAELEVGRFQDDQTVIVERGIAFDVYEIRELERMLRVNENQCAVKLGVLLSHMLMKVPEVNPPECPEVNPPECPEVNPPEVKPPECTPRIPFEKVWMGEVFKWEGWMLRKTSEEHGHQLKGAVTLSFRRDEPVTVDRIEFSKLRKGDCFLFEGIEYQKHGKITGVTKQGEIRKFLTEIVSKL